MQSTSAVFQMMQAALSLDPSKTGGVKAVYQFNLTGEDGGVYQMILDEEAPRIVSGIEKEANCILEMDAEKYKKMVAGEINPTQAFMSGVLKIEGDLGLALLLQNILHAYTGNI